MPGHRVPAQVVQSAPLVMGFGSSLGCVGGQLDGVCVDRRLDFIFCLGGWL